MTAQHAPAKTERPVPRPLIKTFWAIHRAIVRVSGGRLGLQQPERGAKFGMLRLHTVGRRSGQSRVAMVGYFEDGPNLVTQGSTELVHALLADDLVDAMSTFTVPVVLGRGKKLFADGSAPHSYTLTRSRVSTTGLVIAHYERAGDIKIGDTALDSPSDAERARQERMKREG